MTDAVKRTLLAMALLLSSVFGVTGCGSDDDVPPVESRIKNTGEDSGDYGADDIGDSSRDQLDSDDFEDPVLEIFDDQMADYHDFDFDINDLRDPYVIPKLPLDDDGIDGG